MTAEYPFTFACQRSGNCCSIPGGYVRLDEPDQIRIAEFLGMAVEGFRSRYVRADGATLRDREGGRCVFLEDGRQAGCGIYSVRPEKCATFPYWPELLEDPEALAAAARRCPGIEPIDAAPEAGL